MKPWTLAAALCASLAVFAPSMASVTLPPPPPPESASPSREARDTAHGTDHASHAASPDRPPSAERSQSPSVTSGQPSLAPDTASPETGSSRHAARNFVQVFTAQENAFMRPALLVGVMVAVVCAYLGFYVILKRVVFLGLALAEVSSAGVALGLAISVNPVLVSIGTMLVGVVAFSVKWSARRIPQDAFIGVGFAFASAAALLLVASSPVGEAHMLDLLRGDILTVQPWELFATGIGLGFVAILHLLFTKELLFVSFDPETAAASGYNVRMWEMALFLSVGLTIALGIHATGVLFTSGALVIPATTALLLSKRFTQCAIIAVALGALPVPVGLYISFVTDMSASASVVAVSFALLVVAAIGVRASHR